MAVLASALMENPEATEEGLYPRDVSPTVSWGNVVQKKKSLTKYDLKITMEDGKGSVVIPNDIFVDSSPLWEDFLIRQVP